MTRQLRRVRVEALPAARRDTAKCSFTTRRVPPTTMQTLVTGKVRPRSGDVVLATVARLGHHRRLEQPDGRRAQLHVGDEIIVVYADRYAPDQFEAHVPPNLSRTQLVASGGIASSALSRCEGVRAATDIEPVGLVGDAHGRPLNLSYFALEPVSPQRVRPRTVAIIGTSMNSGKTTTIQHLVQGLSRAGARTGASKATGTGSGGDYWVMLDAGAHRMLDFTDVGLASTYRRPMPTVQRTFSELLDHLTEAGTDVNFVEIADGIYQQETSRLIDSKAFRSTVDVVLFAASDSAGAVAGVSHLRGLGLPVAAVTGRVTRSPLSRRETEAATGLPVLTLTHLDDAKAVCELIGLDQDVLATTPGGPAAAWPATALEWDPDRTAPPLTDLPVAEPTGAPLTAATLVTDDIASEDVVGAELVTDSAPEQLSTGPSAALHGADRG